MPKFTSDGDVLFRAICQQPQEDTPRLMFADWLEENGQPVRAEFIRYQCEFPEWDSSHPRFDELLERDKRFEPYFEEWMKPLPRAAGVKWWDGWWRGFVDSVTFMSPKAFRDNADAVFAAAPMRLVEVRRVTTGTIQHVLQSAHLKRLSQLILLGSHELSGIEKLASCVNLANLDSLCIWGGCTDEGAEVLAVSPHLTQLTCLSLSSHTLTERGLNALIESQSLRAVTRLVIHGTERLGDDIVRRLHERFASVD